MNRERVIVYGYDLIWERKIRIWNPKTWFGKIVKYKKGEGDVLSYIQKRVPNHDNICGISYDEENAVMVRLDNGDIVTEILDMVEFIKKGEDNKPNNN